MNAAKEFFVICSGLKKFIEMDLTFVDDVYVNGEKCNFSVAKLDDVWVYLIMQKVKKMLKMIGIEKTRINYYNLYFIIYDKGDLTKEDLFKFSRISCNNKIILSDKKYSDIDCVQTIIPNKKRKYKESYLDRDFWKNEHLKNKGIMLRG